MVKNICMKTAQPYRLLVSDEMNVVAFVCKGLSKLCCQNTASAESWIANDTYIHIEIILKKTLKNTANKNNIAFLNYTQITISFTQMFHHLYK